MSSWMTVVIAAGSSLLLHLFLLGILYVTPSPLADEAQEEGGIEDAVAQKLEQKKEDFFEDVGDPDRDLATNDPMPSDDKDNVAAPVMENEPVGSTADATPVMNDASIPPPPGVNAGAFAGLQAEATGDLGGGVLNTGGMSGALAVGGIAGRSGGGKKAALTMGGGSEISEASVARGLKWLANHQMPDGSWAMDTHVLPNGKACGCNKAGKRDSRVAGTAFGLLPMLAAGITHKPNSEKIDEKEEGGKGGKAAYHAQVQKGLNYLIAKQDKRTGAFSSEPYSHSLATIAMCEAAGMTSDPLLRASAQKAIIFVLDFQDPSGGGWRYSPKQAGDTSVTGWMFMALKSAQMAGLRVAPERYKLVERFLDSVMDSKTGIYGYEKAEGGSPAMTAVGMLSRLYLGTRPSNENLRKGGEFLKKNPPAAQMGNIYYLYYATQAMHHMGAQNDCWDTWNLGPNRNGKNGIRDLLIEKQIGGPKSPPNMTHMRGSWDPLGGGFTDDGGRLMMTSLALLSLEVYYRHLPLYMSEAGAAR